jgi:hypothetical protein
MVTRNERHPSGPIPSPTPQCAVVEAVLSHMGVFERVGVCQSWNG